MFARSLMLMRSIAVLAFLLIGFVQPALAQGECTPDLYRKIITALGANPDLRPIAADWIQRFQVADDVVARGMLKSAVQKDVKALVEGFRSLEPGVNPFTSEAEVYRVIGELTDSAYRGVPGLDEVVGNLFAATASNEKGALFSLKVASETGLAGKVVAGNGAGFEQGVSLGDAFRRYDMREPALGAPAHLGGIVHENKNWTTTLSTLDGRLEDFADQFRRDIIIHASTNWSFYRINFRQIVAPQSSYIRDRLMREFDDDFVKARLNPADLDSLRKRFAELWGAGAVGGLVSFH